MSPCFLPDQTVSRHFVCFLLGRQTLRIGCVLQERGHLPDPDLRRRHPPGELVTVDRPGSPWTKNVLFCDQTLTNRLFSPTQVIKTGLQQNFCIDWTNSGELLVAAGKVQEATASIPRASSKPVANALHFYNPSGQLVYRTQIPCRNVRTQPVIDF